MSNSLQGATVLITGGTGTFGNAFLDKCIEDGAEEVRIFSRDEEKQYAMAQRYRKANVRFFLGDIRDKRTIDAAMSGVDYVFHAAAMKQVPSCERFPIEAVKTNITGSDNLLSSAIGKRVKKVVCLSTDKAVYPTSAMGLTKAYMEKLAMQKAMEQDHTKICVTRFGNLIASRGSAIPLFIEQVYHRMPITITDPNMTRFLMTVEEAVDLVAKAFSLGKHGELLVKQASACATGDLANAVFKFMGLPENYPINIIGIRRGEKMHEALLTEEEAEMGTVQGDYIVVSRSRDTVKKINAQYRSELAPRLTEEQLVKMIQNVFKGGAY